MKFQGTKELFSKSDAWNGEAGAMNSGLSFTFLPSNNLKDVIIIVLSKWTLAPEETTPNGPTPKEADIEMHNSPPRRLM